MRLKEGCCKINETLSKAHAISKLPLPGRACHGRNFSTVASVWEGLPVEIPRVAVAHRTGFPSSARDAFVSASSASRICVKPRRNRTEKTAQVGSVLGASCSLILKHNRYSNQNSKLKAKTRHTAQRTDLGCIRKYIYTPWSIYLQQKCQKAHNGEKVVSSINRAEKNG